MDNLLAALGVKNVSVVIAGAVGGTISLRHYVDLTVSGKVAVITSSMLIANYTTYPIVSYFGSVAHEFTLFIAVGIGLFGLSIISSVTALVKDADWLKGLISNFFGGRK